jgi:predicted phage terminase large subunit-like protein
MRELTHAQFLWLVRTNFLAFLVKVFHQLNPGAQLTPNWHLSAMAHLVDELMAARITRSIVNLPPRELKSIVFSVAFPAFVLAHRPGRKFMCITYSGDLAEQIHSDFRRVVESEWYKKISGITWLKLTADRAETMQGGGRLALSVSGAVTGFGADFIVIDDPINAPDIYSKQKRESVNRWFNQSARSRLNKPRAGAIVVVAQRLHMDDLPGVLLPGKDFHHLCLPAINDRDRKISLSNGTDKLWRKDELLIPERLDLNELDALKATMSPEDFAAQFLQSPVPESGILLRSEWLIDVELLPVRQPDDFVVTSWDTAQSVSEGSAYSVGVTFLVRNKNQFFLVDICRERLQYPDLKQKVIEQERKHRPSWILIEDKSTGSPLIQELKASGLMNVIPCRPDKDKATRMRRHTLLLDSNKLRIPVAAEWRSDFRLEYLSFPYSRTTDSIDAMSQFFEWYRAYSTRTVFECDWGTDGDYGAPDPEEIFRRRGRR